MEETSRPFSLIRTVQAGYYAVLPYLAYVAVFAVGGRGGLAMLLGWIVLLVYQILFLGLFAARTEPARTQGRWLFVVPPVLIGVRQVIGPGTLWNFFLEEMLLEAVTLVLVFVGQLLFTRNREGRTAWADLGITPLLVGGLLGLGMWDFARTWWEVNLVATRPNWLSVAMIAAAFVVALSNYWRAISAVRTGRLTIREVFPDDGRGIGLIIGQIVLWFAIGGLAGYFFK